MRYTFTKFVLASSLRANWELLPFFMLHKHCYTGAHYWPLFRQNNSFRSITSGLPLVLVFQGPVRHSLWSSHILSAIYIYMYSIIASQALSHTAYWCEVDSCFHSQSFGLFVMHTNVRRLLVDYSLDRLQQEFFIITFFRHQKHENNGECVFRVCTSTQSAERPPKRHRANNFSS